MTVSMTLDAADPGVLELLTECATMRTWEFIRNTNATTTISYIASVTGLASSELHRQVDALVAMGLTDKAMALLREALSRDPDNAAAATKLRRLKRQTAELASIREKVQAALSARRFEAASALAAEGLRLDIDDKQVAASLRTL